MQHLLNTCNNSWANLILLTVYLNPDSKLYIPAEIESQLKPGDRYTVTVTADSTVFQKLKAGFDWEELRRRRD